MPTQMDSTLRILVVVLISVNKKSKAYEPEGYES